MVNTLLRRRYDGFHMHVGHVRGGAKSGWFKMSCLKNDLKLKDSKIQECIQNNYIFHFNYEKNI